MTHWTLELVFCPMNDRNKTMLQLNSMRSLNHLNPTDHSHVIHVPIQYHGPLLCKLSVGIQQNCLFPRIQRCGYVREMKNGRNGKYIVVRPRGDFSRLETIVSASFIRTVAAYVHERSVRTWQLASMLFQWKFWDMKCPHEDTSFTHHVTPHASRTHCSTCTCGE